LHHSVHFIRLEVSNQLNDSINGWLSLIAVRFLLLPCLDVVTNKKFEPEFCFEPKCLILIELEELFQMFIFITDLVAAQVRQ
jgi:hypothetical protein